MHGGFFTVYPFGYYPYGRSKLLDIGAEGGPVSHPESSSSDSRWDGTLAQGVMDAAQDVIWPRNSVGDGQVPGHILDATSAFRTPGGKRVGAQTVYRWLALYQEQGATGLESKPRDSQSASRVLDSELVEYLRSERKRDPRASTPELIRRARVAELVV